MLFRPPAGVDVATHPPPPNVAAPIRSAWYPWRRLDVAVARAGSGAGRGGERACGEEGARAVREWAVHAEDGGGGGESCVGEGLRGAEGSGGDVERRREARAERSGGEEEGKGERESGVERESGAESVARKRRDGRRERRSGAAPVSGEWHRGMR